MLESITFVANLRLKIIYCLYKIKANFSQTRMSVLRNETIYRVKLV